MQPKELVSALQGQRVYLHTKHNVQLDEHGNILGIWPVHRCYIATASMSAPINATALSVSVEIPNSHTSGELLSHLKDKCFS